MNSADLTAIGLLLKVLRLNAGLEQAQLGAQLGVSQATVSRWEHGALLPVGAQVAQWLEACAGRLDPALSAAIKRLLADCTVQHSPAAPPPPELAARLAQLLKSLSGYPPQLAPALVPYYADIAAGIGEAQEQRAAPRQWLEVPPELLTRDPGCYALRVVGDSMAPMLLAGDIVIVSPAAPLADGCVVAAYIEPDGDVVKLYRLQPGGGIQLQPVNPAYPALKLGAGSEREARIWGRVVLLRREL